ncbi:Molybdopterin synthase catalytic subunit [Pseudovibrio sp. Ad13]|uniref:molybdenum cofactor biosynthesis protein MoaE n=1 Tax=unclassified Pseudovibrio TaxID=2627060 RepID=UPI0007AED719|nr:MULTISPECIES: molybdenum cofactor biosynthesis protein MoaE [unclassified Pseudovibrio]KZK80559.1 Molybdopterin synthase catalytic subunit [Pseudovibrio sp. Ad13]KZL22468.1 Molybdopterin synthase catalytic subunit [Pseudovibrio sp. WM33]
MSNSTTTEFTVRVQAEDFDVLAETEILTKGRKDVGAIVTFTGLCRDEGGTLEALELEHYPGMAEAQISKFAQQAVERWPLTGLTIIHRFGKIPPGDNIVLVIATSSHRRAAFEASDFLMDFLKTQAPFWKKEHLKEASEGTWVEAKAIDDADAARWDEQKTK